ncbi:MAG: hypothetical protein ACFBSD_10295 [Paracoccaceae bacterium]
MLDRLLAPRMIRAHSPTADLYLADACRDWLAEGRIRRLAPGVFASRRTLAVIRHWGRAGRLPERSRRVWLIDDDIDACLSEPGLPVTQRWKLRLFEQAHGRALCAEGATVVATSAPLATKYRAAHRLDPHWSVPFASLDHHGLGRVRIGLLFSATHRGDLAAYASALAQVLDLCPDAELHLAANHRPPPPLAGHPRLRRFPETSWPAYRTSLSGRRLHLALYPLLDTATNRARSINKLIEHAVAGAAGVYSASWSGSAAAEGAGLLLPPEPDAWADALPPLIADRDRTAALAAAGQARARTLNRAAPQRELWAHLFDL